VKRFVIRLTVMAAMTVCVSAASYAQSIESGPYVTVGGGIQHRQRASDNPETYTDWKNGYAFNVAGGYRMGAVGIEGEFSQLNNHDKTTAASVTGPQPGMGDVTLRLFMANVNYTVKGSGPLGLFVGGGVGGYKSYIHDLSNVVAASFGLFANGTNDGVPFVYQLRGGATYDLSSRAALLVNYRYIHGNELLFKGTDFGDLRPNGTKNHVAEVAIRLGF
jgi:opacity protein-like surface antigen